VYDPTVFVKRSIKAVITTLLEAVLLVVLVVVVFLQTWRASVIPLAAVPVSLVGTFAVMHALGFSINNLSLFGLVLAIGIVVDDAIVVVENVERNIGNGLSPVEATRQAMKEVTGPIIATALVLCAVFVPTAFISGLTGQFYRQFAITIAISTVISAVNSLTLSPALSALLLRGHGAKPDLLTRLINGMLGWFFRPFNRFFGWSASLYTGMVRRIVRFSALALLVYGGLVWLTWEGFGRVPVGFVPAQDKQYRTEAVMKEMSEIALRHPGVSAAIAFPGLSIQGFTIAPNEGIVFVGLKPFEERTTPELSGMAIVGALNAAMGSVQDAYLAVFPPPAVNGLGAIGGFKLMVTDRGNAGYDALYGATQALLGSAMQSGSFEQPFSGYTVKVPQLEADVDREKAKAQKVPLQNLFETLQINLGSLYVNDFNRFGRTYQVVVQADDPFRDDPGDITRLRTRNEAGQMVPVGSLVRVRESFGPSRVTHYNGYLAADFSGAPYQKIIAGNTAVYIYPLCVILVFMVLAAQYESLRLPLAIILIVPLCLLFALVGVVLTGGDNNIFTQIGFIVLIGLACKNSILIVEFAREKQHEGMGVVEAALEACRLRLRPILMTSIAFIAGVYPLVVSTGAGAEMRRAMGSAVFAGMIGVTFLGLFLTPVFYVLLMKPRGRRAVSGAEKPVNA